MEECANLGKCGFFKNRENDLASKGFIRMYCRGELQNECKRKEYKEKTGKIPPDEMYPNGAMRH
jgi:hypothetical protein